MNFSNRKIKIEYLLSSCISVIRVRKLVKWRNPNSCASRTPLNILTTFFIFFKMCVLKIFVADEIEWRSEDSPNTDLQFYKFSFNWSIFWSGLRPTQLEPATSDRFGSKRPIFYGPQTFYSFDQLN